jgi:hypothetical protein
MGFEFFYFLPVDGIKDLFYPVVGCGGSGDVEVKKIELSVWHLSPLCSIIHRNWVDVKSL